jgi:hypothetical protein
MDWRKRMRVEGQQLAQRADIYPSRANQIIQHGDRLWYCYDKGGRIVGTYHSYEEALRGVVNS